MKTILIIEDNNHIRENIAEILELAGFEIVVAENGIQGLHLVREQKPDLILCDIRMPEMGGFEVLSLLKNDPSTDEIPFIYVAASVEKHEVERAMKMGANGYISKSFDGDDLIDCVREFF